MDKYLSRFFVLFGGLLDTFTGFSRFGVGEASLAISEFYSKTAVYV